MPTYEYECNTCKKVTEVVRSLKDIDKAPKCPSCGEETHRIVSCTAFRLNGDGWGRDGYTTSRDKSDLV